MVKNIDNEKYEIPANKLVFWMGKQNANCLIIPVINEGERIVNFVKKLNELAIYTMMDIIIVDGGSSDGSLDVAFLKENNIRGLILKTGEGKLSSQLRCGYAFALDQNYEGILTIDGNGKDDPSTLPLFVKKLDEGYDFIQASRFVKGGTAVNTPLSRYVAIRLIHAPVLSFFSGFWWTDTTQGYRAYSKKMLQDPNVKIFRKIFAEYELLAYLSYRIPKLGYKCLELPTARIYPEGEVPTKIKGMRGNVQLIKVLFNACLGNYNP
jgi:dolichol-phosphate mannosyltransferase